MEKQDQSQSPNQKSPEKRAPQQGGNVVWYLLGLGVLLLLLVSVFNNGKEQQLEWSKFEEVIRASNPQDKEASGYIEVDVDRGGPRPQGVRLSDLSKVVIGESAVTATITRQPLKLVGGTDGTVK